MANLGPPLLPFRTNSTYLCPTLLRPVSADAQRAWRLHAPFDEWWPAADAALLARPFIPVRELGAAVEHVSQACKPSFPTHSCASGRGPSLESHRLRRSQRSSAPLPRLMKDTASRPLCSRHCLHCWHEDPPPLPPLPHSTRTAPHRHLSRTRRCRSCPAPFLRRRPGREAPRLYRTACRCHSSRPTWQTRARTRQAHSSGSSRRPPPPPLQRLRKIIATAPCLCSSNRLADRPGFPRRRRSSGHVNEARLVETPGKMRKIPGSGSGPGVHAKLRPSTPLAPRTF